MLCRCWRVSPLGRELGWEGRGDCFALLLCMHPCAPEPAPEPRPPNLG